MIELNVEQGSYEWIEARRGLPTASEFDLIVTPETKKYSASARRYMLRLLADKYSGDPMKNIDGLPAIQRGKELEPSAALAYEFEVGAKARKCGLILTDDRRFGASPDRLIVSKNGGLEIKCPEATQHLDYWDAGFEHAYHWQRQGQIFVAELDYVDMWSFHPNLPSAHATYLRNDEDMRILRDCLNRFSDEMSEIETKLLATGFFEGRGVRGND